MCARLLSCPLCSQPGFVTLDALRAGLVSVATRPLACPVCNETLLGIDKLTIHLFGHTINAHNRSDPHKSLEINRNTTHDETLVTNSPGNWNTPSNPTLLPEQTQTEGIADDKLAYVPLSGLNSRNVAAIVNKSTDSSLTAAAGPESMEKTANQIIFVPNLRQQQQFCSPAQRNVCSVRNSEKQEVYGATVPLMFQTATHDNALPLTVSSQAGNSKEIVSKVQSNEIYGRDNFRENSAVGMSQEKIEIAEQYSENWIENLLQNNSNKSSKACDKTLYEKKKNYSTENSLAKEDKYSDTKDSQFHSQDCANQRSQEIFNGNHPPDQKSCNVLPQLKALRLLAMKDKTERCNICGVPVPDRNILILHKQVVHMIAEKDINAMPEELLKSYPCHLCTKIFKNRGSLMVHTRIAHIGYNFGNQLQ